jgi:hypothetical protein
MLQSRSAFRALAKNRTNSPSPSSRQGRLFLSFRRRSGLEADTYRAPAPLTSRKLRSPQDLNRRCPLARPIPTGPPHRSMFSSTGWRTKILRAADAFYARRREGPYRLIQKRPRTSVVALKSDAATEKSEDQLSRDFLGVVRFFRLLQNICQKPVYRPRLNDQPSER